MLDWCTGSGKIFKMFVWERINPCRHFWMNSRWMWNMYTQLYLNFRVTVTKLAKALDLLARPET